MRLVVKILLLFFSPFIKTLRIFIANTPCVLYERSFLIRTIPSVLEFHQIGKRLKHVSSQTLLPVGNYAPPQRIFTIFIILSTL